MACALRASTPRPRPAICFATSVWRATSAGAGRCASAANAWARHAERRHAGAPARTGGLVPSERAAGDLEAIETDASPIRRWPVVAASALFLALAMGAVVIGMSDYVVPPEAPRGWARADAALVDMAGILGLSLGGIAMGRLADRRGARPVVLFGAVVLVVLGACHLLAALTTAAWQLTGLMFVAGLPGAAAILAPAIALAGRLFPAGAGLAIGIVSAGRLPDDTERRTSNGRDRPVTCLAVHRALGRSRHRAVRGIGGGFVRRCPGRDRDQPLQDRGRPPPRAVA